MYKNAVATPRKSSSNIYIIVASKETTGLGPIVLGLYKHLSQRAYDLMMAVTFSLSSTNAQK